MLLLLLLGGRGGMLLLLLLGGSGMLLLILSGSCRRTTAGGGGMPPLLASDDRGGGGDSPKCGDVLVATACSGDGARDEAEAAAGALLAPECLRASITSCEAEVVEAGAGGGARRC